MSDGGRKRPRRLGPAQPSARGEDPRPSVAERVAIIRRRLVAREWHPDQAAELAEEWGISEVLARAHAAEASRQIEAMADQQQVRQALDGLLLEAADAARKEKKHADRARALCLVVKEGRELAGIGRHRDPKNDPKPEPAGETKKPFWRKPSEVKPS